MADVTMEGAEGAMALAQATTVVMKPSSRLRYMVIKAS